MHAAVGDWHLREKGSGKGSNSAASDVSVASFARGERLVSKPAAPAAVSRRKPLFARVDSVSERLAAAAHSRLGSGDVFVAAWRGGKKKRKMPEGDSFLDHFVAQLSLGVKGGVSHVDWPQLL